MYYKINKEDKIREYNESVETVNVFIDKHVKMW